MTMEFMGLDWDVVTFFTIRDSFNNRAEFSVDPLLGLRWDVVRGFCSWSGNRYKQRFSRSSSVNYRDNWFLDSRGRGTEGCRGASPADSWSKESFLHAWVRSRWIVVVLGITSPPSVSIGHRLAYSAGLCG